MKLYFILFFILFLSAFAHAQENYGIGTGSWSGLNSLYLNPANIADSRQKTVMSLGNLNLTVDNSMGFINPANGISNFFGRIAGGNGNANGGIISPGAGNFNMLGPVTNVQSIGFLFTVNHRNSIALTTRVRAMNEFTNFNPELYSLLNKPQTTFPAINNATLNWTSHLWTEVNLAWGSVLIEQGKSELKLGVNVRYLGGVSYAKMTGTMSVKPIHDSMFEVTNSNLQYATNQTFNPNTGSSEFAQGLNGNMFGDFTSAKPDRGIGGDIGLVYEYQPHADKYRYDTIGRKNIVDDSRNRYKFKLSAAIVDLGSITYRPDTVNAYNITGNGYLTGPYVVSKIDNINKLNSILTMQNIDKTFNLHGADSVTYKNGQQFKLNPTKSSVTLQMPTRLLLSADYNIYKNYYVNAAYQYNLAPTSGGLFLYNQFVLTPRLDTRSVSVGFPVTISSLANDVKAGIGVRAGGFFIGSDDMLGFFGVRSHGFNAYMGFHMAANKSLPVDRTTGRVVESVAEHPPVATWQVIAPVPDVTLLNTNLFVSLKIDSIYHFASITSLDAYLDDERIAVMAKVKNNKLEFIYTQYIKNGKHTLRVEAKVKELKLVQSTSFDFTVGKIADAGSMVSNTNEKLRLSGTLSMDSRDEFLSGPGQALRQEPNYTRTFNLDAVASYKDMSMPVKVFATTDDRFVSQSPNYFEIGFKKKWLELDAGDMNPVFDRLVLNGVRVRGVGLTLKKHNTSFRFVYGTMTQPVEGVYTVSTPGNGVPLVNLAPGINNTDTVLIPGVYRRTLLAARFETGNKSDNFKFGYSIMRVKDDTGSIHYGVAPKENLVSGADVILKLFHHAVSIQAGMAASIISNDITSGPINKDSLKTEYKVTLPFDPASLKDIIVLNASTLPLNPGNFDYTSVYTQLNYSNKYQTFTFDYKKNGALYSSLGNPYLQSNYQGVNFGERFSLFKKKVGISMSFSDFSDNLNLESYSTVNSQSFNSNIAYNPGPNLPSVLVSYLTQRRTGDGDSAIGLPGTNDRLNNYLFNISLAKKFWNLNHRFRLVLNVNNRKDNIQPQNSFYSYNWLLGISENFAKNFTINADGGQTLIKNADNTDISRITVYNFSIDWQIKPRVYFTSLSVSNNRNAYIQNFSDQSYKLSVIGRFGYRFYKGMGIDIEGGYQPYVDKTINTNNYNELYAYLRYTCDLSRLLVTEPRKDNFGANQNK